MMAKRMTGLRVSVFAIMTALILGAMTAGASADPIEFTHEGNGSGTLNGTPFVARDFVITAFGDTTSRLSHGNGWYIDHTSASISITGLGVLDFLTGTRTFVNTGNNKVGFSRAGRNPDLFNGPTDTVFNSWDMLTSIGPVTGPGYLLQWGLSPQPNTNAGILYFNDATGINTTFTAEVVPEPATLSLLVLGATGLVLRRWKKA